MFIESAHALADQVTPEQLKLGMLFPAGPGRLWPEGGGRDATISARLRDGMNFRRDELAMFIVRLNSASHGSLSYGSLS
jgi:hypothetical protein